MLYAGYNAIFTFMHYSLRPWTWRQHNSAKVCCHQ